MELIETINDRRSIRKYKDIDVPNEIIFLHVLKYIQDKNFELSEEEYKELDELANLMLVPNGKNVMILGNATLGGSNDGEFIEIEYVC